MGRTMSARSKLSELAMMSRDPDVAVTVRVFLNDAGAGSLADLYQNHRDEFDLLYETAVDLVDQLPDTHLGEP